MQIIGHVVSATAPQGRVYLQNNEVDGKEVHTSDPLAAVVPKGDKRQLAKRWGLALRGKLHEPIRVYPIMMGAPLQEKEVTALLRQVLIAEKGLTAEDLELLGVKP